MDIPQLFSESFNDIISNPKILLPYIILGVLVVAIAFILILTIFSSTLASFYNLNNKTVSINSTYNISNTLQNSNFSFNAILLHISEVIIFISILSFIISVFVNATLIAVAEQLKTKTKVNLITAFKRGSSRYLSLLAAGILIFIIMSVILGGLLFLAISFISSFGVIGLILGVILIIIAIILFVLLSISFFIVNPLIIIEELGPIKAIKKSFNICYNKKLDVFLLLIIASIIDFLVYLIIVLVNFIPILGLVLGFVIGVFVSTWFILVPVYFYYALKNKTAGTTVTPDKNTIIKSDSNKKIRAKSKK